MFLNNTFRNLKRTREIIGIFVKYGFEDVVTNSTLRNLVSERRRLKWLRQERPVFEYTRWERVRMAAEELGPTFVKLGQVLSNRPDMLPEPLIQEFEKLQDKVPPFPFEQVRQIIEAQTGVPLNETFAEFIEKPLASASIGQVHSAKLNDGKEVVVKVQRPGVQAKVEMDLAILKDVVRRADRYLKKQGILNAMDVVNTFERTMNKELDYRNEARNIERFRHVYRSHRNFYIPKAFRNISTDKFMVIEFADGCKISDIKQLKAWGLNPKKVAENGMDVYLTQIFEFGYFHADPHPGNVLVRKDGVICLIDFGMVGKLMQKDKYAFAGVFISLAKQDAKEMAINMKRLAIEHNIEDMRAFEFDLSELIEDFASLDVSESSIAEMIARLQKVMFDYQIRVPGSVFLIFRAFAILEGIGKTMHPHFNTYEFVKPYGAKIIKEQLAPEKLFEDFIHKMSEIGSLLNSIPLEFKSILQKARKGKIHFEVEHQGYGYLLKKLDSITNRIVISLIISALVIGSAISMTADFPPEAIGYKGIPHISLTGLFIALVLFLILIYAIVRRRLYK